MCVSNTLFMSDNLSPVIAPNASAPSATESSTGPEGSQDGQQAPAANGAGASASAHDHATEIANPRTNIKQYICTSTYNVRTVAHKFVFRDLR